MLNQFALLGTPTALLWRATGYDAIPSAMQKIAVLPAHARKEKAGRAALLAVISMIYNVMQCSYPLVLARPICRTIASCRDGVLSLPASCRLCKPSS